MPLFTIETTYRLPAYRQHTYEAVSIDEACRHAIDDDDWSDEKRDYESAGETFVTGIWAGESAAYSGAAQSIPSHYAETPQRIALHFKVLLGLIKVLAGQGDIEKPDRAFWLERGQPAIVRAEALLAGERDPD
ncbi:hypothetical protein AAFX91_33595 [Bradyrhizobium sp. 31Argb]|uniref:hypothetical protein n=1 Tax=Bradyrhizobium sp. 31Argb TaxID=3141247 RepID=UPI003748FCED